MKRQIETVSLKNQSCPAAILPNTGGNGYYRWALPSQQWLALMPYFETLSANEQISVANSLSAALNDGSMNLEDYLLAIPDITRATSWRVAMSPWSDLHKIKDFVARGDDKNTIKTIFQSLYQPQLDRLNGLNSRNANEEQFRVYAMSALANGAEESSLRDSLLASAIAYTGYKTDEKLHPDALASDLRQLALGVGAQELGQAFADLLWKHFLEEDNAQLRQYLLFAIAQSPNPDVAAQTRERILSPHLRDNEVPTIYYGQMSEEKNRNALWKWSMENMDSVLERVPAWKKGQMPRYFSPFCDRAHANEIEAFFTPMIDELESGPRYLANALETIRLCAEFVDRHRE